jgi:hypothetical protein
MEPVDSIPCSQEPATGSYPESYQSNPYHPILQISTEKARDLYWVGTRFETRQGTCNLASVSV